MKKYIPLIIAFILSISLPSWADGKLFDIDFTKDTLTDSKGNLTSPSFIRNSANTDNDANLLAATRPQLILIADQNDDTNWPLTIAVTADTTYILSTDTSGATVTVAEDTATLSSTGSATYGTAFNFTCTSAGDITLSVSGSSTPRAMLKELPSGNIIGNDMVDQEGLGSELVTNGDFANWTGDDPDDWSVFTEDANNYLTEHANGARLVSNNTAAVNFRQDFSVTAEKVYMLNVQVSDYADGDVRLFIYDVTNSAYIISIAEMGWQTDGSHFLSFIAPAGCATARVQFYRSIIGFTDLVYANVSVKEITSPHKGTYSWPYSAGAEATISNADFSAWTGDDPDDWDVSNEDANNYVTEHADGARIVSNNTTVLTLSNTTPFSVTANKLHILSVTISNYVSGDVRLSIWSSGTILNATNMGWGANGTYNYYFFSGSGGTVDLFFYRDNTGNTDYVISDVSVRPIQTSITPYGNNTLSIDETNDQLVITYVDDDRGAYLNFSDAADLSDDLTATYYYEVTVTNTEADNGDVDIEIAESDDTQLESVTLTGDAAATNPKLIFQATNASTNKIQFDNMGAGEVVKIGKIEIKQVPAEAMLTPSDYVNSSTIPAEPVYDNGLILSGYGINLLPYWADFSEWTDSEGGGTSLNLTAPNGDANSATTFTASAANHTLKYTVPSTVSGAKETFSLWMKRITGTGDIDLTVDDGSTWETQTLTTAWQRFDIQGTETAPVAGIRIVTSGDAIGIYGADLKPDNFLSQAIPTDGCPAFRSTESGEDGVSGLYYTTSAPVNNILANGTIAGTLIVEGQYLQDYDAVDTDERGLISVKNGVNSLLSFGAIEGSLRTDDGTTNHDLSNINWTKNDKFTAAVRWSDVLNKLHISHKLNDTWDLDIGNESTLDADGFTIGTKLWLSYANELPVKIKRIVMYDGYLSNIMLTNEIWHMSHGQFSMELGLDLD